MIAAFTLIFGDWVRPCASFFLLWQEKKASKQARKKESQKWTVDRTAATAPACVCRRGPVSSWTDPDFERNYLDNLFFFSTQLAWWMYMRTCTHTVMDTSDNDIFLPW